MKKTVLLVAMTFFAMLASANNTNVTSFAGFYPVISSDTTSITHTTDTLSRVVFFDIDHIKVNNPDKKYIRIETKQNELVLETYDSVDVVLNPGTYYVYSNTAKLIAKFK